MVKKGRERELILTSGREMSLYFPSFLEFLLSPYHRAMSRCERINTYNDVVEQRIAVKTHQANSVPMQLSLDFPSPLSTKNFTTDDTFPSEHTKSIYKKKINERGLNAFCSNFGSIE